MAVSSALALGAAGSVGLRVEVEVREHWTHLVEPRAGVTPEAGGRLHDLCGAKRVGQVGFGVRG